MRARTPDLYDEDQRAPKSFAKDSEATPFSNKLVTAAKPDAQNWGINVFAPPYVHDVGISPIELSRAYMEAQTSATVHESQWRKLRALSHGVEIDNSASKLLPKIAVDSPVRWPGSVVRDHTNYLTPQSNKGRTLPPTSSRSPYFGSVFRKSIKRTGHHDTYCNSSGRPQLSTPFSAGSKAILEDRMPSTIDVLGVQLSTSQERACADTDGTNTPFFPRDGSAATKNLILSLERPHGKGTIDSGSVIGRIPAVDNISKGAALSVHPKSGQTAQKILQHLERTIPSPTAKPLELRRTAKRNTPVVISSPYKFPDAVTSNGPGQSSVNERGSAYQAISGAKELPSSSNREEPAPKIQSQVANREVAEMTNSQHPSKTNLATAPAAMSIPFSVGSKHDADANTAEALKKIYKIKTDGRDLEDGADDEESTPIKEEMLGADFNSAAITDQELIESYIYWNFVQTSYNVISSWRKENFQDIYILYHRLGGKDQMKEKSTGSPGDRLEVCLLMAQRHGVVSEQDFADGCPPEAVRYKVDMFEKMSDIDKEAIPSMLKKADVVLSSFPVTERYRSLLPHDIYRYVAAERRVPPGHPPGKKLPLNDVHCVVLTSAGRAYTAVEEADSKAELTSTSEPLYEYLNSYSPGYGVDGCGYSLRGQHC